MRRWLLPVMLAVAAASSGVLAVLSTRPARPVAEDTSPPASVPVLSARRVPELLSRLVADTRLRAGLESVLAAPALGAGRDRSCLVVREGHRPVFSRRPDERLIPASNLKVLTAMASLDRLGPGDRFVTEVRAGAGVGPGGMVDGPLWLVGGGDPLLATGDYAASFTNQPQLRTPVESLADAVVAAGVREVRGPVLGDESRYDTQRYVPTWRPVYITDAEVGPASALEVNDGFIQFSPRHVAAAEPAAHAAAVLAGLLQARGVRVEGGPGVGRAPAGAPVVGRVSSAPVAEVVGEMLRESDNLTAELLVKELGARFGGRGTTSAGLGVVREALSAAGLPVAHLVAVDGSGLDRSDRSSCTLLLAALHRAGPGGALAAGFPVAARTGTLARRFTASPAAGRLRAKTGSLDGVAALTGYVDPLPGGQPLAFSLLANDLPLGSAAHTLQEQVANVLARYPDAPAAAALAP